MSELQIQHAAHKARLARMGGFKPEPISKRPVLIRPIVGRGLHWRGIDPAPFWPQMWMWDLVDWQERREEPPRVGEIIRHAAAYFGIPASEILSSRRTATVVRPRQVAMYLAKTLTLRSLPEIGRRFGGRDHTTVLHAVRKMTRMVEIDPEIESAVIVIKRRLGV